MQPKLGRLKKRSEFLKVAGSGRKWVASGFVLQARQRPTGPETPGAETPVLGEDIRVGYTASRKVGNAVARNRAKRRLRAACGDVLQPSGQPGHDYVVIARSQTLTEPYQNLVADLTKGLRRLADKPPARSNRGQARSRNRATNRNPRS